MTRAASVLVIVLNVLAPARAEALRLTRLQEQAPVGLVELRGVAAGAFEPDFWKSESGPHLVPDVRHPLIQPLQGTFRNIYAPSIVPMNKGWRVFYGAWDGVPTGNDRIYSVETTDFITFSNRRTVIEHGPFQHVCNVSAIGLDDGAVAMMCTMFPDPKGLNKPGFFFAPDGKTWNGRSEPAAARPEDFIRLSGYPKFESADVNGMNVILRDGGKYRLYFNNFRDFGKTFRASSDDGRNYQFDQVVLRQRGMVNDVKIFHVGQNPHYLMGLHHNADSLMFSLSESGLRFPAARILLKNRDEADRYIVSVGWVVRGNELLGVMYGAGAKPSLDANRIFARWAHKRVLWINAAGARVKPKGALGPDRALFEITDSGRFELHGADAQRPVVLSPMIELHGRDVFQLSQGD